MHESAASVTTIQWLQRHQHQRYLRYKLFIVLHESCCENRLLYKCVSLASAYDLT